MIEAILTLSGTATAMFYRHLSLRPLLHGSQQRKTRLNHSESAWWILWLLHCSIYPTALDSLGSELLHDQHLCEKIDAARRNPLEPLLI